MMEREYEGKTGGLEESRKMESKCLYSESKREMHKEKRTDERM